VRTAGRIRWTVLVAVLVAGACVGLRDLPAEDEDNRVKTITKPGDYEFALPDWPKRDYTVHVPPGYKPSRPVPVVIALHGGGPANARNTLKTTCPGGDMKDPGCIDGVADRAGYAVLYPMGTPDPKRRLLRIRTWNAGGGCKGFTCISGYSCKNDIDDVGYIRDVLDDLGRRLNVDTARVFATGLSNGGAMAHRLGCQLADRIAAIAPISNGNQYSTCAACKPSHPMPVIEFHGNKDPISPYEGGHKETFDSEGNAMSAHEAASEWAQRNGCASKSTVKELPGDKETSVRVESWKAGCRDGAEVELYTIQGGGHTWPGGYQYLPARMVGEATRVINANELMIDFFNRVTER